MPRRRQQRAIPADNDRDVCLRGIYRIDRGSNVSGFEPLDPLGRNSRDLRMLWLGENDNVLRFHGFLNRTKNSRLPSRPVIADSFHPTNSNPDTCPAATTFSMAAF